MGLSDDASADGGNREIEPAIRHVPFDRSVAQILALLREGFAYMDGRIDPPSSLHDMSLADLNTLCATAEIWSLGRPIIACVILTPKPEALYIGKLCVAPSEQGRGHGRRLVQLAQNRARAHGLKWLELQTRVELVENHKVFASLGFVVTGRTAHPGYKRPTSMTFRKPVPQFAP